MKKYPNSFYSEIKILKKFKIEILSITLFMNCAAHNVFYDDFFFLI